MNLTRSPILRGAMLAMLIFASADVAARGFGGGGFRGGGGGFRGGGSMSMSRGGNFGSGGDFSRSGNFGGGTFSRSGNYSRPETRPGAGGSGTQIGGGDRPSQLPSTRPGSGGSGTRWDPSNRPGAGGSGTQWQPGNRPNHDCPGCGGSGERWDGWVDHPVAAGIAIGAVAGATAAAIGSAYYALPADCPPYYWSGYTYYSCGGAFYEPQYEGDTVVYVTVADPSGGQQPPPQ